MGKRGRPRRFAEPCEFVAVRLPVSLLARVDGFSRRLLVRGVPANRSDAVRYLLRVALDDHDRDVAGRPATFRALARALGGRPRSKLRS